MLVDKFAHMKRRKPIYEPQTFYGQLQHIYVVKFSDTCSDVHVEPEKPVFLVAIQNCKLETDDTELAKLDIHLYTHTGTLDVVDITSVHVRGLPYSLIFIFSLSWLCIRFLKCTPDSLGLVISYCLLLDFTYVLD